MKIISVNDLMTQHLDALNPRAIVISPGPGKPSDYPILSSVLEIFHRHVPILGVCLGFQLIIEYFEETLFIMINLFMDILPR